MCDMRTICVHSYYARSYLCHQTDLGLLINHISLSLSLSLYFLHAIRQWSAFLAPFCEPRLNIGFLLSKFRTYFFAQTHLLSLSLSLLFLGCRFISRDKETLVTVSLSLDHLPRFHRRAMRWAPFVAGSAGIDVQQRRRSRACEYPNRRTAMVHVVMWPSLIRRARCAALTRKGERSLNARPNFVLLFLAGVSRGRGEPRVCARNVPISLTTSFNIFPIRRAGRSRWSVSIPAVFDSRELRSIARSLFPRLYRIKCRRSFSSYSREMSRSSGGDSRRTGLSSESRVCDPTFTYAGTLRQFRAFGCTLVRGSFEFLLFLPRLFTQSPRGRTSASSPIDRTVFTINSSGCPGMPGDCIPCPPKRRASEIFLGML